MANDGGYIAKLEQWFATALAELQYGGSDVFRTADVWRHQVSAGSGGMEAFSGFAPFAFVSYSGDDAAREGGYDLRQVLEFSILVGTESKYPSLARFGDAGHLGLSKIHDLIITLFDRRHPGTGFACDEIYYTSTVEVLDSPERYMAEMKFETSYIAVS